MYCKNCGAVCDENLPKCPYCGSFSYKGAEKEYLNKLNTMKEELSGLEEEVPKLYKEELKTQSARTARIFLILLASVILLVLLFLCIVRWNDRRYTVDVKAQLLFEQEAFPIADEYYEAGDYDGLLEFFTKTITENENADFSSWKHIHFLACYENYTDFKELTGLMGSASFSRYDMTSVFYDLISTNFNLIQPDLFPLDENDLALVSSYVQEMNETLRKLPLTDSETETLQKYISSKDVIPYEDIEKLARKIYKRLYEEELL